MKVGPVIYPILAACLLPGCEPTPRAPYTASLPAITVRMADLWQGKSLTFAPQALAVPILPPTGSYLPFPVGSEAGTPLIVPTSPPDGNGIGLIFLDLAASSNFPVPTEVQIFSFPGHPYSRTLVTGDLKVPAFGSATASLDFDSEWLGTTVSLGLGISTPGSSGSQVAISADQTLTLTPSILFTWSPDCGCGIL